MFCKKCGTEYDGKFCPQCGIGAEESLVVEKKKRPIYKKWWFWVLIVIIVIAVAAGTSDPNEAGVSQSEDKTNQAGEVSNNAPSVPNEFSGECPVEVSGSVGDNIIGVPELSCSIKNKTDKEIAAVKLYFSPKDVYGSDVNTIFTTNQLYTDTPIAAYGSCSRSWQMLDDEIKSGDVYVYSVYFSDGTEWGDKDASVSKIKKYGMKITAES